MRHRETMVCQIVSIDDKLSSACAGALWQAGSQWPFQACHLPAQTSSSQLRRTFRQAMHREHFCFFSFPSFIRMRVIRRLGMYLSRVTTLVQLSVMPLPSRTELAIPRTLSLSGWHYWPWQPTNVSSWPGTATLQLRLTQSPHQSKFPRIVKIPDA